MRTLRNCLFVLLLASASTAIAQKFIHPGIHQSAEDLAYMRSQVLKGEQPWKDAFERMKEETDLAFEIKTFAHVMRGPYGRPNIGGNDLSKGAALAYDCALLWYITNDKAYAQKAIDILRAWSESVWTFDYNDAKLLAGWTGHQLCNAAEILRYTNAGWQQKDIDSFTNMLMTVYYPLMRYYFPQANGNWDGAIIHAILAIAVFTDNREMFDNAVHHFLYGPVNGSIFKYIYPSGQCQETMRDQGHVQLGLGEFAGAARVAYTQGEDLFSVGDNRIALGYEFTASFLMGESPFSYGKISERAKRVRDDYEYVYRHYTAVGLDMPYTKAAADSARTRASHSVLTAFRSPGRIKTSGSGAPKPGKTAFPAGALQRVTYKTSENAFVVSPGESLQEALDAAAGTGRWVIAKAGLHKLPATLRIPARVTLAGEGVNTKLFLDPESGMRDALVNASDDISDVVIRDLVVEGSVRAEPPSDPNSARSYRNPGNRGGIIFRAQREDQMKNIRFENLTVQNCTFNGVLVSGASKVVVSACDFSENGSSVVPGPALQHNLLVNHCSDVDVSGSRLDTSPYGSGISVEKCKSVRITGNEIARNAYFGVTVAESDDITVADNFIEGNDRSGVMFEFQHRGSQNIVVRNNQIQYNDGHAVESFAARNIKLSNNKYVRNSKGGERVSGERRVYSAALGQEQTRNNQTVDGYKGIWFTLGQFSKYGDKYSGGLGTYTAHHSPLAIYAPQVNKTFFVYGGTTGPNDKYLLCMIGSFDHQKKTVSKPVVVHDKQGVDDPHDNPSMMIDDKGYIWVYVSGRNTRRLGYKYRSMKPYDISAFEQIREEEMTYPQPIFIPGKGYFHFFTKYSGVRELYFETSADGKMWTDDVKLAGIKLPAYERAGHYQVSNHQKDWIFTFFNWHPNGNVDKRTNVYYVETRDFGKTFQTAEAKKLTLPLEEIASPARVLDYESKKKNVYLCDAQADAQGNPVCLYVISDGHEPGPDNGKREWMVLFRRDNAWVERKIAESDHNYDMGSLFLEGNVWKVIAPTQPGPQPHGGGGEIVIWESRDQGMTWQAGKQVTTRSVRNHNYVRRVVNGRSPFRYLWADGNPDTFSPSYLYFGDRNGDVYELPYEMPQPEIRLKKMR